MRMQPPLLIHVDHERCIGGRLNGAAPGEAPELTERRLFRKDRGLAESVEKVDAGELFMRAGERQGRVEAGWMMHETRCRDMGGPAGTPSCAGNTRCGQSIERPREIHRRF